MTTSLVEVKMKRMAKYINAKTRQMGEQINLLEKQQTAWFSAYHSLRELDEAIIEIPLSPERAEQILNHNAGTNPQLLAAMKAVENGWDKEKDMTRKFEVQVDMNNDGELFSVECTGSEADCRRTLDWSRKEMPEEKVRLIEVIE